MTTAGRYAVPTLPGAARAGTTLLELIVVLAIIAVLAGAATPMLRHASSPSANEAALRQVAEARASAVRSGRPVAVVVTREHEAPLAVLARPDGSVLGAESLGVESLSGRLRAERARAP